MHDKSFTINELVRSARRSKGLTQAALAVSAGCKQSAISMFEAGRSDALSTAVVTRICEVLGIDAATAKVDSSARAAGFPVLKYCPADECPSNVPYVVHGQLVFKPTMVEIDASVAGKCRYCGEPLQDRCPNTVCGVAVADGAFCPACGSVYVQVVECGRGQLEAWADAQRKRIREIRELSMAERANGGGQAS